MMLTRAVVSAFVVLARTVMKIRALECMLRCREGCNLQLAQRACAELLCTPLQAPAHVFALACR